jgi:hypothetical protein
MSRLDDEPPPTSTRPEADNAARRKRLSLEETFAWAAFDFHRQIVFNGTHAEYDRIDALKPSQYSVRSSVRQFRLTSHRTAHPCAPAV